MSNIQSTNVRTKRRREAQCYESPLNGSFVESRKDCRHDGKLIDLFNGEKRLTRGMLRKLKEQSAISLRRKSSRNSVIIINDSETSGEDEESASSLSVIECSPITPSLSWQQKSRTKELQNSVRQNREKLSNLFARKTSNAYSSTDGENIAPLQTEDDVIELWSSLKYSSSLNKGNNSRNKKKENTYSQNKSNKEVNFVIDTRPNLKNLELLKADTESAAKRRKLCHNFNELTLSPNKSRKKHNTNNKNSGCIRSSTRSNAQFCEEERSTIVSDEQSSRDSSHKLREIIVDGCNVAMAQTNHRTFSLKGIKLVVDYFTTRGHIVKVFLPQYIRKREYILLENWYKNGIVVFTPSRKIAGRQITPHDDRYILEYATACGGIVVSTDQFRDWYKEKPEWRDTILNRLLAPTFVGDYVMFPEDPLGRFGPNLDKFLRF
ncbi:uncharacterized protein LOC114945810 isoform X1 [Nylanderia fulva]|uniref:uncharacterized protein LOC114945810 isoform X1 n=1 Tax=Nylanderia fulva TaxID=613905 RepID=UPI0010FB35D2|nr:uncharacterized protein LOC114945810 isoform X1 [Nylanderia fulva]